MVMMSEKMQLLDVRYLLRSVNGVVDLQIPLSPQCFRRQGV
jgi:hypothetical protein